METKGHDGSDLHSERVIAGRYRLTNLLGQGGMGEVYRAWDTELSRWVAVKLLSRVSEDGRKRFAREARAQVQLNHPSVCPVFEVGEDDGRPHIVMRQVEGRPLLEALPEMTTEEVVQVFAEVAEALHAAHSRGFVHRDVKPSNLMVERVEGRWHPWVMDFGLVAAAVQEELTRSGESLGTPVFMAPEQIRGGSELPNRRIDVYGLGATIYRTLTGVLPFDGEHPVEIMSKALHGDLVPPRAVAPTLPGDLEAIILKAMEVRPERRYPSTRELALDLRRFLAGEPVTARHPSRVRRTMRSMRRRPVLSAALVVVLVSGAVATGLLAYGHWQSRRAADLAVRFGGEASEIESALRMAYMLPRHDIRPERTEARERLRDIHQAMEEEGDIARGPAEAALGRVELTLGRPQSALEHLKSAWRAGSRGPAVALLLGRASGEVFRLKLENARSMGGARRASQVLPELTHAYRDPALEYLNHAAEHGQGEDLVRAMIALDQDDLDGALALLQDSGSASPWQRLEAESLRAEVLVVKARRAADSGRPEEARSAAEEALRALERARTIGRSSPRVHDARCEGASFLLGLAIGHGQGSEDLYDRASQLCREALLVDPESLDALVSTAQLERDWAHWLTDHGHDPRPPLERAESAAGRAVELYPGVARAHTTLGNVFVSIASRTTEGPGKAELAWEHGLHELTKALRLEPGASAYWSNRGFSRWQHAHWLRARGRPLAGELERAAFDLHRAGDLDPSNFRTWTNLGAVRLTQAFGRLDGAGDPVPPLNDAIAVLRRAEQLNPGHPVVLNSLGAAEVTLGQTLIQDGREPGLHLKEAVRLFEESLKGNPSNHRMYNNLATVNLLMAAAAVEAGQPSDAYFQRGFSLIDKALELNPKDLTALVNRVEGLCWQVTSLPSHDPLRAELLERAAATLRRAEKLAPGMSALRPRHARVALLQAEQAISRHQVPTRYFEAASRAMAPQGIPEGVGGEDGRILLQTLLERARWQQLAGRDWRETVDRGLTLLAGMPSPLSGRLAVIQSQLELVVAKGATDYKERERLLRRTLARLEEICPERPLLAGSCSSAIDTANRLLQELATTSSPPRSPDGDTPSGSRP